MPRPPSYTEDEDAILLATAGQEADYVNQRLTAAGFRPRSPEQLKQRRYYLSSATTVSDAELALERELRRRRELTKEQERLQRELDKVTEDIAVASRRIHELMTQVS